MLRVCAALAAVCVLPGQTRAQESSSRPDSSSSQPEGSRAVENTPQTGRIRAAQVERGGAAVTLETNEALFQIAAGLNACGYNADLSHSEPVRTAVRADMDEALAASEDARTAQAALCQYFVEHRLAENARDVAQYVSLSLYLSPPPTMTPSLSELELPPDSAQVVNVLPLVRTFAETVNLHAIWVKHRSEYEALTDKVHDPMVRAILETNIYLHQPVSSYDGRRFLVLLEPMLAPAETNARIYANDYIVVASPSPQMKEEARIDLIRHTYLQYVVEPMVYSRAAAMERLLPLLRPVQDSPLDFQYKSDITALLTECLIKAIEARTFVIAQAKPQKPKGTRTRSDLELYDAEMVVYNKQTELERVRLVDDDMRHGWTLTEYFFDKLITMEKDGDGLRDEIGPMIYGMEVDRERRRGEQILFVKERADDMRVQGSMRQPVKLTTTDLAEAKLLKGDKVGAAQLAEKALTDPAENHGRAEYVMAQVDLVSGEMDKAMDGFMAAVKDSTEPRTVAWSHVYLGRLYDSMAEPHRTEAIAEYKAALAVHDARPDVRTAAQAGLKAPYAGARRAQAAPGEDDDEDFDPSGKNEKKAYQPEGPATAPAPAAAPK